MGRWATDLHDHLVNTVGAALQWQTSLVLVVQELVLVLVLALGYEVLPGLPVLNRHESTADQGLCLSDFSHQFWPWFPSRFAPWPRTARRWGDTRARGSS